MTQVTMFQKFTFVLFFNYFFSFLFNVEDEKKKMWKMYGDGWQTTSDNKIIV